ncbi:hypothetical protein [Microtetraspora malaysiensis]|uniref:hypothetical protein n=1 Tax=Microtetraspora malaysiensis TaxID=161358 RepID=UPI003D89C112
MAGHQLGQVVRQRPQLSARLAVQLVRRDVGRQLGQFLALIGLGLLPVSGAAPAREIIAAERPGPAAVLTRAVAETGLAVTLPERAPTALIVPLETSTRRARIRVAVPGAVSAAEAAALAPRTTVVTITETTGRIPIAVRTLRPVTTRRIPVTIRTLRTIVVPITIRTLRTITTRRIAIPVRTLRPVVVPVTIRTLRTIVVPVPVGTLRPVTEGPLTTVVTITGAVTAAEAAALTPRTTIITITETTRRIPIAVRTLRPVTARRIPVPVRTLRTIVVPIPVGTLRPVTEGPLTTVVTITETTRRIPIAVRTLRPVTTRRIPVTIRTLRPVTTRRIPVTIRTLRPVTTRRIAIPVRTLRTVVVPVTIRTPRTIVVPVPVGTLRPVTEGPLTTVVTITGAVTAAEAAALTPRTIVVPVPVGTLRPVTTRRIPVTIRTLRPVTTRRIAIPVRTLRTIVVPVTIRTLGPVVVPIPEGTPRTVSAESVTIAVGTLRAISRVPAEGTVTAIASPEVASVAGTALTPLAIAPHGAPSALVASGGTTRPVIVLFATAHAVTSVFSVHFCPLLLTHRVRLAGILVPRPAPQEMDYEPDDAERPLPAESLNGCRLSSLAVAFAPCLTRRRPPNWGWPDGLKPSKSPLPHKPKSEPVSYAAPIACLPPSPRQRNPCLTHCGEAPQLLGYGLGPGHVTGLGSVGAAAGAAPAGRDSCGPSDAVPVAIARGSTWQRSYPRLRTNLSHRISAKTNHDRHEMAKPHTYSQQHDQRQRRASASAPPLEQPNQPMCGNRSTVTMLSQPNRSTPRQHPKSQPAQQQRNPDRQRPQQHNLTAREHLHMNRDRP